MVVGVYWWYKIKKKITWICDSFDDMEKRYIEQELFVGHGTVLLEGEVVSCDEMKT